MQNNKFGKSLEFWISNSPRESPVYSELSSFPESFWIFEIQGNLQEIWQSLSKKNSMLVYREEEVSLWKLQNELVWSQDETSWNLEILENEND